MIYRELLCFIVVWLFAGTSVFAAELSASPDSTARGEWDSEVVTGVNLTQAHFDNWTQGGANSIAWQVSLSSNFQYRAKRHKWTNTGNFVYGQARISDIGTRKSADEIKLESVYQYTIGAHVNPFASMVFQTQFARGYNYRVDPPERVSDFMDPGYITASMGAGTAPFEGFNTRLGAAYKVTVTNRFATRLTDDPNRPGVQKVSTEFGISSVSSLRHRIAENILLTSRLELFSNMNRFDEIDVRLDAVIKAKVTAHVDVRLQTELLYDKSRSKKRQLKQVLSMGLSYTLL